MTRHHRSLRLEWKPQDCWVGVFWKHSGNYRAGGTGAFDVWVCLLPIDAFNIAAAWLLAISTLGLVVQS